MTASPTPTIQASIPFVNRNSLRGERRQGLRAALGRLVEERGEEDDAAEHVEPVGGCAEAREGDPARADLDRQHVGGEPDRERQGEEDDGGRAVERHQLVEDVRREERVLGHDQLRPHQDEEGHGEHERDQRGADVEDADLLVVGRRHVLDPGVAVARCLAGDDFGAGGGDGGRRHPSVSVLSAGVSVSSLTAVWPSLIRRCCSSIQASYSSAGHDLHLGPHRRVARAGVLVGAAVVGLAGLVCLEPRGRVLAGDGVDLAGERRDGAAVHDVGRGDPEDHGGVLGDDELLVGEDRLEDLVVGLLHRVLVAPQPLLADHVDRQRLGVVGRRRRVDVHLGGAGGRGLEAVGTGGIRRSGPTR